RRAQFFPYVTAYVVAVPTYVGGYMTLGWAGKEKAATRLLVEEIARRAEAAGIAGKSQYWSPEVHVASFWLPPYIAKHLP
ncbi:MAG: polyamine aminopropyltransferase, partial [Verrucomicrobiota bacterium]